MNIHLNISRKCFHFCQNNLKTHKFKSRFFFKEEAPQNFKMIYSRSRLLQGYWHEVQDVYLNKGSLQKNEVVSCSFQEITIGVASNSSLGNILMYTYCWSFSRKTAEKRFFFFSGAFKSQRSFHVPQGCKQQSFLY